ncbi:phage tail tape measure protein [Peribacillus psychrosaccharolyticus]|uniref:phage tail tape measure protein n=1 Tax=Peribacillus psychrosaccharolyticus TaxID=1407 RepID=UPI003D2CC5E6
MANNNPETTVTFRVFNKDFKKAMKEMTAESNQLRNEFLLQQERMRGTASATDMLRARINYLQQAQEVARRKTQATQEQLDRARVTYGENSQEVATLTRQLTSAQLAEARLGNQVSAANRQLADQTNRAKKVQEALSKTGQKMKDIGSAMTTTVAPAITGLGVAAGVVASEVDGATARIKNSLGVTSEEAEKLSSVARNIYNNGFGESLDDVETALIQTRTNIKSLNDEDLESITTKAKVLADTFDGEVNEVTRAGNNVMKGFGVSADKAFDLMAYGAQNGLNFSNEMFDNLSEYAPLFGKMGFSAEEYFQLLVNGSKAGVYNLDYINDVMKEFQIRVKDGSKATATGMGQLSKGTQKVWQDFLKGKGTVKDVSNAVLAELKGMDNQTDANNIGVSLYGTKWEDLESKAMYSLGGIDGGLKGVKGTMQEMVTTQEETFGQRFQSMLRNLKAALLPLGEVLLEMAEDWLPKISSAISELSKWFSSLTPAMQKMTIIIGAIGAAVGPFLVMLGMIIGAISNLIPVFVAIGTSILETLVPAFAAVTAPVWAIIAAIVAVIAIGVLLWKNWDVVKAKAIEVWGSIADYFSNLGVSIKEGIVSAWNSISSFFSNLWSSISSTASSAWSSFKSMMSSIWEGIKSLASEVWGGLVSTVMGIINPFIQGAISLFTNMKSGISTIFNGIKQFFSGVWGLIKNIFAGALLLIVDLVTGDFKNLKKDAETIFNNLKKSFQQIWSGIKQVFTGSLSAIRGYVTTVWSAIKSSTSSVWEGIKALTSSVWNAIKSAISNAVSGIKNFVTSAWTSIKTFTSSTWSAIKSIIPSAMAAIKSSVVTGFNSLKSSVSSAMTNVKNAITNGWKSAVSFLKGINLAEIGKNIIQGLVKGIGSMMGAVKEKVKSIADSVTSTIRKVLDIHSPSRETEKLGKHTGQGFANGIASKKKAAETAAKKAADAAKKAFTEKMEKAAYNFKLGKVNSSEYISSLRKIREEYAKTPAQVRKVNLEIKKVQDAQAKDIKALEEKQFKDALKTIKDKASAGKLSTDQELKQLQTLAKKYKSNSKERLEIDKEIKTVKDKLFKEQEAKEKARFNSEKERIENKKYYNELSLTAEFALYEKNMKAYKKGSEERQYYEKEVYRVKQEINDKLLSLNNDYIQKISDANQKLIDGEKALTEEYNQALDSRTSSLYSFAGIFDEITEKSEVSGQQLMDNLKGQVDTFAEWSGNIKNLAARGIDEGLIKELQDMGPKSAAEIAALNTLTDEQLTQYVALWQSKNALAKSQATSELEGMKIDTQKKIMELRTQTAKELDAYKLEWATKIKEIRTGTTDEFVKMNTSMKGIGTNTIKGLMDGLSEMTGPLLAQAQAIAESISKTMKKALDIHSPSREAEWIGNMYGAGLTNGLKASLASIKNMSQQMAAAVTPRLSDMPTSPTSQTTGGSPKFEQNIRIYSPTPLSPAETARQNRLALQQFAFQLR